MQFNVLRIKWEFLWFLSPSRFEAENFRFAIIASMKNSLTLGVKREKLNFRKSNGEVIRRASKIRP